MPILKDLLELCSFEPKHDKSLFWYRPGRRLPRIKLLKKAIKLCKKYIELFPSK